MKGLFDLILPDMDAIGDRTGGMTMETPKGLAKALVALALTHPELRLRVRRYAQIPGTFDRSRDVLFPMENTYKSLGFAPWWFFGGFREVALGAMLYHQVISPFDLLESSRDFISAQATDLTLEQRRLRQHQDEIRAGLDSSRRQGSRFAALSLANAKIFRRLGEIRRAKRAEVHRVVGSKASWQEIDREFRATIRSLNRQPQVPDEVSRHLAQFEPDGSLSGRLLQYFEAHGEFHIDGAGGGPWITLPFADGETYSTGLSRPKVLAGDPRVAALVLAAVIDYHMYQSAGRREDIEYVTDVFSLLKQASDAISRESSGAENSASRPRPAALPGTRRR